MLADLPYHDTPADSLDLATEIGALIEVIAGTVAAALEGGGRIIGPKMAAEMLRDTDKYPETARAVAGQQVRLALALESWRGHGGDELIQDVFGGIPRIISESFVALHGEAHTIHPCPQCGRPQVLGTLPEAAAQLREWGYCMGHEPEPHLFVVNPEGTAEEQGDG